MVTYHLASEKENEADVAVVKARERAGHAQVHVAPIAHDLDGVALRHQSADQA